MKQYWYQKLNGDAPIRLENQSAPASPDIKKKKFLSGKSDST
jgi:hypothetical protein